jgi:Phage tail lysozyme
MTLFEQKAPAIMRKLMGDFDLDLESAAAILGNLGHESGGFRFLQEKKPLVPGSRGGYGWAQWTGPRRRQYEAYCLRNGLDPASDEANYGFLFVELKMTERAAVPAVKGAIGLREKVEAFELAFERAGVKHYDGRMAWAMKALTAFKRSSPAPVPPPLPPDVAPLPKPKAKPAPKPKAPPIVPLPAARGLFALIAALLVSVVAWLADHWPALASIAAVVILFFAFRRWRTRRRQTGD